jgi:nucleoside-diphosphate-sugar epimerase
MSNETKTAMVIGATGSFGGAVTRELLDRGWMVRALVRDVDAAQAKTEFGADVSLEYVQGDALVKEDVARAAKGADLLVDSFNVSYEKWDPLVIESAEIVAQVAAEEELLVLFPGNVYGLGPDFSEPLDEGAPKEAPSKKGALRNRIEGIFERAAGGGEGQGARFVVLRCGDFFGPDMPEGSSWFSILVDKALDGGAIVYPGDREVVHQWAYLPDAATAGVDLAERALDTGAFDSYEVFHFGGHAVTGDEIVGAIRRALGDPQRKVKGFMWWAITIASPFVPFLRELKEMRYLWDEPLVLDDAKLRQTLDRVPHTQLDVAVHRTLSGLASEKQIGGAQLDDADLPGLSGR